MDAISGVATRKEADVELRREPKPHLTVISKQVFVEDRVYRLVTRAPDQNRRHLDQVPAVTQSQEFLAGLESLRQVDVEAKEDLPRLVDHVASGEDETAGRIRLEECDSSLE